MFKSKFNHKAVNKFFVLNCSQQFVIFKRSFSENVWFYFVVFDNWYVSFYISFYCGCVQYCLLHMIYQFLRHLILYCILTHITVHRHTAALSYMLWIVYNSSTSRSTPHKVRFFKIIIMLMKMIFFLNIFFSQLYFTAGLFSATFYAGKFIAYIKHEFFCFVLRCLKIAKISSTYIRYSLEK